MIKNEFQFIRQELQKTQKEMGRLLGISSRAVQSFEQGWRRIPGAAERHLLFLYSRKTDSKGKIKNCWELQGCPPEKRRKCPAWEFKAGGLCWFVTGTLCRGKPHSSWERKISGCRKCEVFLRIFPPKGPSEPG
jgi:hypothetical protein